MPKRSIHISKRVLWKLRTLATFSELCQLVAGSERSFKTLNETFNAIKMSRLGVEKKMSIGTMTLTILDIHGSSQPEAPRNQ